MATKAKQRSRWGVFTRQEPIIATKMPRAFLVSLPGTDGNKSRRTINGIQGDYLVYFPKRGHLDIWGGKEFEAEFRQTKSVKLDPALVQAADALAKHHVSGED
ncbi:MAG: hypothetical protein ACYS7M_15295 [Planctomycetota bacterium]|jgi:hypothetical protein